MRYMTSSEFQAGGVGAQAGQDTGNKNKFATVSEAVKTAAQIPQGFKDLIGRRCEERGIVFRPLPGSSGGGRASSCTCVAAGRSTWTEMECGSGVRVPTSLNSLLDRDA